MSHCFKVAKEILKITDSDWQKYSTTLSDGSTECKGIKIVKSK